MLKTLKKLDASIGPAFAQAAEMLGGMILATVNSFAVTNDKEATPVPNFTGRFNARSNNWAQKMQSINMSYAQPAAA